MQPSCSPWQLPSQPVTVGAWRTPSPGTDEVAYDNEVDQLAFEFSDIITFHAYCDRATVAGYIEKLSERGRPMLSTEWMARPVGSPW